MNIQWYERNYWIFAVLLVSQCECKTASTQTFVNCRNYLVQNSSQMSTLQVPEAGRATYEPYTSCMYEFKVPSSHFLQIVFKNIDLEWYGQTQPRHNENREYYGQNCPYDYLQIYNHARLPRSQDGSVFVGRGTIGKPVARLCHGDIQNSFGLENNTMKLWSRTGSVLVHFMSDKDSQNSGVTVQFTYRELPLADYNKLMNYDYPRITQQQQPQHHQPSDDNDSRKEHDINYFLYLYPLVILPILCCTMVTLIKQAEMEQMDLLRDGMLERPDSAGLPLGQSRYSRAQHALYAGLLERRPSVMELAARLVQEDALHSQRRQAANDIPPQYVDPLQTNETRIYTTSRILEGPVRQEFSRLPAISTSRRNVVAPASNTSIAKESDQESVNSLLPSYSSAMLPRVITSPRLGREPSSSTNLISMESSTSILSSESNETVIPRRIRLTSSSNVFVTRGETVQESC